MLLVRPGLDVIFPGQGNSGPGRASLMSFRSPCSLTTGEFESGDAKENASIRHVWGSTIVYGGGSLIVWAGFGLKTTEHPSTVSKGIWPALSTEFSSVQDGIYALRKAHMGICASPRLSEVFPTSRLKRF